MTVPVIMPDPLSFVLPFTFDIVTNESHEATAEPTEFPVELGANITDHIKINPEKYTVTGIVSEIPNNGTPIPVVLDIPIYTPFPSIGAGLAAAAQAIFGPPPPIVVIPEQFPIPVDPIKDMHDILLFLKDSKTLCSVTTTTVDYTDMAITSVAMSKKDDEGKAEFTVIFEHIVTVSSETVAAPKPTIPAGAPKASGGAQTPPAATDADKASFLKTIKDKVVAGVANPFG
jgi:hypothetical protein